MMFAVLKNYHLMIGVPFTELHQAVFPPVLAPVPKVMHACGAPLCVGPWGVLTGKPNPTEISASGGIILSQCTDIGPLIPHYNISPPAPPNALLPLIILTSGSKSHFGAHSHVAPKGPVAFACAVAVNLNLNCAGPAFPPFPSGVVPAFNTHTTGVTVGDIVAGIFHMAVDLVIQFGLNRLFSRGAATALGERIAQGALGPLFRLTGHASISTMFGYGRFGSWAAAALEETLFGLPNTLAAVFGIGSPLGYSPGYTPAGGSGHPWNMSSYTDGDPGQGAGGARHEGGGVHGATQRAWDRLCNSDNVEQFPSQAPAAAPAGT